MPIGPIHPGEPFLYILGERKIENGAARVENFEVVHELASVEDNLQDNFLPNLDESKIHSADFPLVNGKAEKFGIHWPAP